MADEMLSSEQKLNLDIKVDARSACERHITITIARADIDRFMDREFAHLKPVAQLPGFRPGRAPMGIVKARFYKDVADRVKNALLMESISQVNDSENLAPISDPMFDYLALELPKTGDFTFEYDIEVRPEFELPEWKGMKLEKPVRDFTDADIEAASVSFRSRMGKLDESEEGAAAGDYIATKLFIRYNDEIINSSEHEVIRLRPSLLFSDATIEKFDEQMDGVKAGETRTLKFTLSESAPNVLLRGKEVDAVFEVQKVYKLNIPAVDEEFLNRMGMENKEAYDAFLKVNLESQMVYQQQQVAREKITALLLESADWDLPPVLLERQAERELYRTMLELQRSGFPLEKIQEHLNILRQNSLESTKKLLKEHFILERIAENENIEAEEADYDEEIQEIAARTQDSARRVRARLEKQNRMDILRNQIIERKVIELILNSAEFEETTFEPYPEEMATVEFPAGGTGKAEEAEEAENTEEKAEEN
ncbi:MAG: trigger factor [Thermoguttaceae bacterium]|nr:trigger factor [Thermoguttaceae bacterium]MBP3693923.1 trigger factor [Thermoguttaceae bacterium]